MRHARSEPGSERGSSWACERTSTAVRTATIYVWAIRFSWASCAVFGPFAGARRGRVVGRGGGNLRLVRGDYGEQGPGERRGCIDPARVARGGGGCGGTRRWAGRVRECAGGTLCAGLRLGAMLSRCGNFWLFCCLRGDVWEEYRPCARCSLHWGVWRAFAGEEGQAGSLRAAALRIPKQLHRRGVVV